MGSVDPKALALCIVFPILAILSVLGRFYARSIQKAKWAADDWMIIPALFLSIGNAINVLYGAITANLGQHMPLDAAGFALIGPKIIALEKMAYASEVVVCAAVACARLSVLLFYARIFSVPKFRIIVYISMALNIIWGIGFTLAYLFQCTPIDELWTVPQGERTHCINDSINYYQAISTILLDVMVLTIPWPIVWRLKMPLRQKVAVSGIFMLGGIVTAASIGKCVTFFRIGEIIERNHDLTYDEGPLFYWTVPECNLSIVCACLPTLRPIFHGMSPESVIGSIRSALSLSSLRSNNGTNKIGSRSGNLNTGWEDNNHAVGSTAGLRKTSTGPESMEYSRKQEVEQPDIEMGTSKITVTKEFNTKVERVE